MFCDTSSYEVFIWKMKTPKTSAFDREQINFLFLSYNWLFLLLLLFCLVSFVRLLIIFFLSIDISFFVLCLLFACPFKLVTFFVFWLFKINLPWSCTRTYFCLLWLPLLNCYFSWIPDTFLLIGMIFDHQSVEQLEEIAKT